MTLPAIGRAFTGSASAGGFMSGIASEKEDMVNVSIMDVTTILSFKQYLLLRGNKKDPGHPGSFL
jgi:hypothetical protein